MSETSQGQIITFYSYKGGTGRTMALANVAWILATNGKRVLSSTGTWSHRGCISSFIRSWTNQQSAPLPA